jgi:hypothetical protein
LEILCAPPSEARDAGSLSGDDGSLGLRAQPEAGEPGRKPRVAVPALRGLGPSAGGLLERAWADVDADVLLR